VSKSFSSSTLLTPREVAALLGVSPVTVRQWAQKGLLPAETTAGGHRRFRFGAVSAFARESGFSLENSSETRLLIVDDDPQLGHMLEEMVTEATDDWQCLVARDGFDAGSKVQSFQPEIVLLDIMMPGMDGFDVCRRIKQDADTSHIRVIGMTGYYSADVRDRLVSLGAETCLPKPLQQAELLELLGIPVAAA
jgi:excisionase family DNA binding protein